VRPDDEDPLAFFKVVQFRNFHSVWPRRKQSTWIEILLGLLLLCASSSAFGVTFR